jgi:hypothetical protein
MRGTNLPRLKQASEGPEILPVDLIEHREKQIACGTGHAHRQTTVIFRDRDGLSGVAQTDFGRVNKREVTVVLKKREHFQQRGN